MRLDSYKREISAAAAFAVLLLVVAVAAPGFFTGTNLRDLALNNAPVLLIAIGAALSITTSSADAQTVRGRLLDAETGGMIMAGTVRLRRAAPLLRKKSGFSPWWQE